MNDIFKFTKLGLLPRIIVGFILMVLCVYAQVKLHSLLIAIPFVLVIYLLWKLKPYNNKLKDQGLEEWRAVSDDAVNRIADSMAQSSKVGKKSYGLNTLKVLFIVVLWCIFILLLIIDEDGEYHINRIMYLDTGLFLIPAFFFGSISVHEPVLFNHKLSGFIAMMGVSRSDNCVLTPYFRFDKDDKGQDVPEDMRLMLEPKNKPADFIGVQIQASINSGATGAVPYMYAVFLTQGQESQSFAKFSQLKHKGYIVEAKFEDNYGTVVLRQGTGGTGYHTTPKDCVNLMELVIKAVDCK